MKYRRPLITAAIPEEARSGSRKYDMKVSRAEAIAIRGLGMLGRDESRVVMAQESSHMKRR